MPETTATVAAPSPTADPLEDAAWHLFLARTARLRRQRRLASLLILGVAVLLFVACAAWTEFLPGRIAAGLPRIGEYFGKLFSIVPHRGDAPVPVLAWSHLLGGAKEPQSVAYWLYRAPVYARLLWQTVQMAIVSTVMGFTVAFVLSFPATRTLVARAPVAWALRRVLEVMRSIPQVVLAFILVWPFGIGPLAGILAIGLHSAGALGKLFSELNENADPRPVEAMRAVGGSWVQQIRYGMVPQMLPGFLSYTLLRFEINVRSSTVIGFVGAGGIGQELFRVISFNIYEEVSAIVILILLVVAAIDLLSERVRHRFIGAVAGR